MKLETKFELHTRVFYANMGLDCVDDFVIEKIEVLLRYRYSGSGGTIGILQDERYYDEDDQYKFGHNLYATREEAIVSLEAYRNRFPVTICKECGTRKAL